MQSHFDSAARDWDKNPEMIERANVFALEISDFHKDKKKNKALEFGCGTGLLSFFLKETFTNITLIDTSKGMIEVLSEKIEHQHIDNLHPVLVDLLSQEANLPTDFDAIYTLMTLHHVLDIEKILQIFNSKLNTNGYLCIADLITEDGSFHAHIPDFDGHFGFDKQELEAKLAKCGFSTELYKVCYQITRKTESSITVYPIFLLIAKKI